MVLLTYVVIVIQHRNQGSDGLLLSFDILPLKLLSWTLLQSLRVERFVGEETLA